MDRSKFDIRIFEDLELLSRASADMFVETAAQAVRQRGRFLVALSGGSTPMKLYQLLAQSAYSEQMDWKRVHVFWGDERCVPTEDSENSYRQARDAFLNHISIPQENIHRVNSEFEPGPASVDYALMLKRFASPPLDWPRFDLILLGMGEDGHTASLFPGSDVNVSSPTLAVTAHYQGRPADRVTLTPRVFNAARRVLFLVSGQSKSQTLANVLYGEYQPEQLPAQRIRPNDGDLIWMVDQAAAGKL